MSDVSKPRVRDLPIAIVIATIAVGSGVFLAETTAKVAPDRLREKMASASRSGDWFGEYAALGTLFNNARKSGAVMMTPDSTVTGSVSAQKGGAKTDRLLPKAQSKVAPAADASGKQASAAAPTAKAVAFGALAPSPWLKIKVTAADPQLAARVQPLPAQPRAADAPPPVDSRRGQVAPALAYTPQSKASKPFTYLFRDGSSEGTVLLPPVPQKP